MVRRAGIASVLVVAAIALYAAVDGLAQGRSGGSSAGVAHNYSAIASLVAQQQRLLRAGAGTPTTQKVVDDAVISRNVSALLKKLRTQSTSRDEHTIAVLAASYRGASQASARALRRAPGAGQRKQVQSALARLAHVEKRATASVRAWQNGALSESKATVASTVGAVATALTAIVALAVAGLGPLWWRRLGRASQLDIVALESAASTDSLTGLGNHRSFHHDLSVEIQRRSTNGSSFTLLALDLDGLKQINDAHGHLAGDLYIKRVAAAMRATTGAEGAVYRVGGDEFMILLPGQRNWHGLALAQRIDLATREAVGARAVSVGLTESVGAEPRHEIIHQADVALYEAKRTRLSALTYHPGLLPEDGRSTNAPSHHQKTLAAALARAVDAKDNGTRSHSETVAELCTAIGRRLGIEGDDLERLRLAGLLHDVGKIGVSDALLRKAATLAADELEEMKEHVAIGHGILISAEMAVEAEWVLHHHERVDGRGYPGGLQGGEIPLQSRIIAAADAFEAMTGDRPYRTSVSTAEAIAELHRHAGSQFDTRCVQALVEVVDQESIAATAGDDSADPQRGQLPAPALKPARAAA